MVTPVVVLPQRLMRDIFAALFLFRRYRIRHLPVVDDREKVIGIISYRTIRQVLRPANLLKLRRVSDVMTLDLVTATLTTSVVKLVQLMAEHNISCVVITQDDRQGNKRPVGIVTEGDIVQFHALGIDLLKTTAQTVMSTPLFLLSPEDTLWKAHQEMQKRHVGRLVVSWDWGQKLGIVTLTNLLRVFDPIEMYQIVEHLQQTIDQLKAKADRDSN